MAEVIGTIAACLQLTGTLLGTIRLAKDLKETPKRIGGLLRDVEKSTQAIQSMLTALQPGSDVFDTLSADQFARLSAWAVDARRDLERLRVILEPLFPATPMSNTRRIWRAVVCWTKEKEIMATMETINRSNRGLLREVQFATLGLLATLRYHTICGVAQKPAHIFQ